MLSGRGGVNWLLPLNGWLGALVVESLKKYRRYILRRNVRKDLYTISGLVGLGVVMYLSPLDNIWVVELVSGVLERLTTLLFACLVRMSE